MRIYLDGERPTVWERSGWVSAQILKCRGLEESGSRFRLENWSYLLDKKWKRAECRQEWKEPSYDSPMSVWIRVSWVYCTEWIKKSSTIIREVIGLYREFAVGFDNQIIHQIDTPIIRLCYVRNQFYKWHSNSLLIMPIRHW